MEAKIAHLEFVQRNISRMSQNSFLLKGWSITIMAALFALAAKDSNRLFVLLAYFPCIMFWGLDAFFLHQERLFRDLYSKVASDEIASEHFTLDTSLVAQKTNSYWAAISSKTLLAFHGCIICILLFVMFGILNY